MNTNISRRRLFTMLAATGGSIVLPGIGAALAMDAGQVAHRINKADRMSMLTERTAKAVALLRLGVNREEDLKQLLGAHDEINDILLGFMKGEGSSGVTRERIVGIQIRVTEVETLWAPVRTAVEEILASGEVDDAHFELIVSADEALEDACHHVVKGVEDAYGGVDIDASLAMAIDLAGRQRMITQKMTKELALVALGHNVEHESEAFVKNCKKFGKIVDLLIAGGSDYLTIVEPPTKDAKDALLAVKAHWDEILPLAEELHATAMPSPEQVKTYAEQSEKMLTECDNVTNLYERFVAGIG
jgi:hypothetical protein